MDERNTISNVTINNYESFLLSRDLIPVWVPNHSMNDSLLPQKNQTRQGISYPRNLHSLPAGVNNLDDKFPLLQTPPDK